MADLKHVGRIITNKRKVVVAYRTVPNEPDNCIVVTTENLPADEHDTLMKLVESAAGQESNDLATVMARTPLPDGRMMLAHFHKTGKLTKFPTNQIEMIPNRNTALRLDKLNELIAERLGITVEDLAVKPDKNYQKPQKTQSAQASNASPLSDEDLAKKYISDATAMETEAARLRAEAEKILSQKTEEETVG